MTFRAARVFMSLVVTSLLADELAPLRTALEKQAQYKTVRVDVRQTKRIPALSEPVIESGHLWLVPGKSFRWEIGKPLAQSAVYHGGEVFLMDENKKTGLVLSTEDRRAKPLLMMLGIGEGATFEGLQKTFTIAETNKVREHFIVSLVPKGQLKRAITGMVMQVNISTSFLERIEWNQKDGTVVVTEFFPPVLNSSIPTTTFEVKKENYTWE
jgi:outer membrane lipoprotein-sorting protein